MTKQAAFQGLTATAEIEDSKEGPESKKVKEKEPRALAMEERDQARAAGMIEGMGRAMTMLEEKACELLEDDPTASEEVLVVATVVAEALLCESSHIGREMWRTFGEQARPELRIRGFKVPEKTQPQAVMVDELADETEKEKPR